MKQYRESQVQELRERIIYVNDSGEFQDVESTYSGTFSHVPSQPAGISGPRSMLSCDKRLQPDTWNLSGSQETFFQIHLRHLIHHKHAIEEFIHFRHQVSQVRFWWS